ncbi:hypothetical protein [Nocardia sp. NPDC059691]|uniref:hypothetical protein n=1 Tax=unclassified Nocardia TaxID=2637762 RepID=UPI0036C9AED0
MFRRVRDDLRGMLRRQAEGHNAWIHGKAEGVRETDRVIRRSDQDGYDRIAGTREPSEAAGGSAPVAARSGRTPLTDLSHMRPLGDLFDGARRGDLDDYDLTRELGGLQRKYGPYHLEDLGAWYERPWEREDGSIHPDNVGFTAKISGPGGEDAGSLLYSFTRDNDGRLVVTHDLTELNEGFTGKGFSTAFAASTEDYFRRSGVDRIELTATRLRQDDSLDGAVAWAKAGYDWNPDPVKLAKSVNSMRSRIDSLLDGEIGTLSPADTALLQDMRTRFDGPPVGYPSPQELVMLTGDKLKLGEELMKGSSWHGMKKL